MKNFLKDNLPYTLLTSIVCVIAILLAQGFADINIFLIAILSGILNFIVTGFVMFKKNLEIHNAKFKQRETYISTLNHDLKIPTLAQIQALKLLSDEKIGKINKRQKELVNLTMESCTYMYKMLSTILSTYKYENKEIYLRPEKILVTKLVEESFDKSMKILGNKNIKVRIRAKENSLKIHADKTEIRKAFENLIDYCSSSAQENSNIICDIKRENSNLSLSLSFKSPYVTSDLLQNQFKNHITSAEKFNKVGSGPGLYLAKQIINAHKGSINIKSSKSRNIYNVELPCINDCKLSALK